MSGGTPADDEGNELDSGDDSDGPDASKMGVGIAIGVALGASFGVAFDDVALGMGMGIAVGVALGVAMDQSDSDGD
ncbi:hypothetical protein [Halosimplex salinum]|uniref:hypothetical protein n=1 Tax=Halosimplex salinum TaxID=1710538 RepID=UPI000F47AEE5|nr:hypothetical protein [Halosimplex salinum]